MKLIQLSIENFLCHEKSVIDFTQFSSALVVGKIEGNDAYSNGVGKTSIFKAIEYVLFGIADVNLEKIIRDDCNSCKVTLDFESSGSIYRVSRARTKKGSSDLSLFQRNGADASFEEAYSEKTDLTFWKDISGRRVPDTEKDLIKLIKINPKAFRSTVHFAQNDFSGLTSTTPEKRKLLLKEALSLSIYSKLEKLAKERSSKLTKEIDKQNALLQAIGNPDEDIKHLTSKSLDLDKSLSQSKDLLQTIENKYEKINLLLNNEKVKLQDLNNQNKYVILQKNKLNEDQQKLNNSINDLTKKKNILLQEAKTLASELKNNKEIMRQLELEDYSKITSIESSILSLEEKKKNIQVEVKSLQNKIKELEFPLPEGGSCKHCRQVLTSEHIESCKKEIKKEINQINQKIIDSNESLNTFIIEHEDLTKTFKDLSAKDKKLSSLKEAIVVKEKQLADKKQVYNEYNQILKDTTSELEGVIEKTKEIDEQIKESSIDEINKVNEIINSFNKLLSECQTEKVSISTSITSLEKEMAVVDHVISQKELDIKSKKELNNTIKKLNADHSIYPKVIDSFSSHGIPNLIIQNLLDDLQDEANKLLEGLKPGLQLQFVVEKENKDDTLDILYFVQGKPREYEQLSGAMKLSVNFSLKLGLSFLLQKMFDTKINFLLLDEIDQALDKAGVDAFADIVKFFQKDFTIMVITHNDKLKDKFNRAILVEQNKNMISTAKVVSNW